MKNALFTAMLAVQALLLSFPALAEDFLPFWNGWRSGRFGLSAPSKNRAGPMSAATQLGRVATKTLLTFLSHALNGCVSIQNACTAQVGVIGAIRAARKGPCA